MFLKLRSYHYFARDYITPVLLYHIICHDLWCIVTGPFNDSSIDYLLVADYRQQYVYQLQPSTGELRSLFTDRGIYTVAMALDLARRMVYLAYVEGFYSRQYRIGKRSFDGSVNIVIYYASSGVVSGHIRLYMNL